MERARDVEIFVVSRAPPGIDSYVVIGAVLGACRIFTGDGDRVSGWWRKIQPTVQEELGSKPADRKGKKRNQKDRDEVPMGGCPTFDHPGGKPDKKSQKRQTVP